VLGRRPSLSWLANPKEDTLAFGAASLAALLRGKKPLSRE
jgi:hypothetical protein